MSPNVGSVDKILRIVVGLGLIAFALFGPETPYTPFAWIGVLPLATAVINFCPAYALFGIHTRAAAKDS